MTSLMTSTLSQYPLPKKSLEMTTTSMSLAAVPTPVACDPYNRTFCGRIARASRPSRTRAFSWARFPQLGTPIAKAPSPPNTGHLMGNTCFWIIYLTSGYVPRSRNPVLARDVCLAEPTPPALDVVPVTALGRNPLVQILPAFILVMSCLGDSPRRAPFDAAPATPLTGKKAVRGVALNGNRIRRKEQIGDHAAAPGG